ncbi:MAG TPA: AraC family transcriptional regulator [Candidatus Didemnitutus sp.]|nr:AraC family transcriptional regulator [Candidatus Didemnitutus sp.]
MPEVPPAPRSEAILSSQVNASRYFFLSRSADSKSGLTLTYGGYEHCNPDYLIQRDGFQYTVLELVAAGHGSVTMNGRTYQLRPGAAYVYSLNTRLEIRTDPAQPMAKYFLCLAGTQTLTRLRQAGLEPNRVRYLAMFPEVQNLVENLIREGQHHRRMVPRICGAVLEVLLLKIEELTQLSGTSGNTAEEQFLRCKGIIDAKTEKLTTLTEIAGIVGVESSHLCRLFRRYQGMSPYQYLLRRKMTLAAERLMDSNCLVKEAAQHVGFADPYHFSRCFKAVHGQPPREFQRSLQRR